MTEQRTPGRLVAAILVHEAALAELPKIRAARREAEERAAAETREAEERERAAREAEKARRREARDARRRRYGALLAASGAVAAFVSTLLPTYFGEKFVSVARGAIGGPVIGACAVGLLAVAVASGGSRAAQAIATLLAGASWGCLAVLPLDAPFEAWKTDPGTWTALGGGAAFTLGAWRMQATGPPQATRAARRTVALLGVLGGAGTAAVALEVATRHPDPYGLDLDRTPGRVALGLLLGAGALFLLTAYRRSKPPAATLALLGGAIGLAGYPVLAAAGSHAIGYVPTAQWVVVGGSAAGALFAWSTCTIRQR